MEKNKKKGLKMIKLYKDKKWLYNKFVNSRETITEIAKECKCGHTTIRNQLKKFGFFYKKTKKLKCEICGKDTIRDRRKNPANFYMHTHINIEQEPSEHYFCSNECKLNFIYDIKTNGKI